tara:strand:- start:393 stop:815 length:423 start_codon:yes stop_codon:yes gene_type:complete
MRRKSPKTMDKMLNDKRNIDRMNNIGLMFRELMGSGQTLFNDHHFLHGLTNQIKYIKFIIENCMGKYLENKPECYHGSQNYAHQMSEMYSYISQSLNKNKSSLSPNGLTYEEILIDFQSKYGNEIDVKRIEEAYNYLTTR